LRAFDRLMEDAVKRAPSAKECRGWALKELSIMSPRHSCGARHVQMEPVWAARGSAARCAARLPARPGGLHRPDQAGDSAPPGEVIAETAAPVRVDSARALGEMGETTAHYCCAEVWYGRPGGTGQAFESLLQLERAGAAVREGVS
jgi:hypothetical protein